MLVRARSSLVLTTALSLGACGTSTYTRNVSVNPPDASLYINGELVGSGDARARVFDFTEVGRVWVQATHPDYQPKTEKFERADIERLIATNTPIIISLRGR